MRKMLPFLGIVIAASLILLGWQIFSTPSALIFLISGILICLLINKRRQKNKRNSTFLTFLAVFLIVLGLASNQAFWWLMFLLLLFVGIFMPEIFGESGHFFWRKKKYFAPQINPDDQAKKQEDWSISTNKWFGDQNLGNQIYQWHDINLKELAGDTIIDLGNTLLPADRENIVILQKGLGNTRILVPFGTGIYLEHSTFMGEVTFADQRHQLKNQSLQIKTPDYQNSQRRIRIVTSQLAGDLEVVFV
ncbi:hypothetical protein FC84_GL000964 [Lapidilactobacillus dextrinicus DSM 20335]|uniref:Uncharacterized protein n=1 Tax=Lapidilactobacillus dextrinicus DSM 20335 TaxID=1423738 RepID=A0A0R2BV29_9LACO|nr:cell wall-active antibiotics response protein LiaF [Lapidilactobacillus dextrinicus]KRM79660.1 hypothetical protein FC84_GL000964 [Lapidilactobacillus dextrinicus DSM 20335]QFG47106.1 hypothetical protein LH506_06405 [Lapidilactobacillus dextrinicus]